MIEVPEMNRLEEIKKRRAAYTIVSLVVQMDDIDYLLQLVDDLKKDKDIFKEGEV